MTSRLRDVVVDCHDPRNLAQFWCEVLDYRVISDEEGEIEIGPRETDAASPSTVPSATLLFLAVPDDKERKNRLHLDLSPVDRDQAAEVQRVLALGARRVDIGQGDQSWVVLADPEGNEFCILGRRIPEATG